MDQGRVEASVDFGGGAHLVYALVSSAGSNTFQASLQNCRIEVSVPAVAGRQWAEGNEVAMSAEQGRISILIEKDFKCMHKDDSANADAYPNPMAVV
jgi:hypothetical protein